MSDKQEAIAAQTVIFTAMTELYADISRDSRFRFAEKRAYTTLRNAANHIAAGAAYLTYSCGCKYATAEEAHTYDHACASCRRGTWS